MSSTSQAGIAVAALTGAAGALYGAYTIFWWYEAEKVEKPKYTVEEVILRSSQKYRMRSFNEVEVRRYEPYIIAEATMRGMRMKDAQSQGFMKVAKYIFGENDKKGTEGNEKVSMTSPVRMEVQDGTEKKKADKSNSEKIPMTAPVQMQVSEGKRDDAEEGDYKISFVMPSKYDKESLPVPKDAELELKEVAGHRTIVHTSYGGSPSKQYVQKVAGELRKHMEEHSLQPDGDVMVYQYHPPFAPNFLRRVEVLYKLQGYVQQSPDTH